jgi:hypothetical protein
MIKELCFDLDGTLAGLFDVPNWLEKIRAYDPTPYQTAEPLVDMAELACILRSLKNSGIRVAVITWLSKEPNKQYDDEVRKAKRAWLKSYGFPFDSLRCVAYGTPKHKIEEPRLKEDEEALLFDDDARVRRDWNLGGAIDPTTTNILDVLKEILSGLE